MNSYTVILFYNYVDIVDPNAMMLEQKALAIRLGLKGRMIIAPEGVNGTFEGTDAAIEEYCSIYTSDPRFRDTHIKKSIGTGQAFPKLSIKVRKEIVTLGLTPEEDVNPQMTTGKYLEPEGLREWFEKGKDFVIVDMRNNYEHISGHFKGSILPPLENFRDLPGALPALEPLKEKTVLTVCTGGVRCEKASGFLVKNGFKNVYQLHGGIVSYMEKYRDNQEYKGSLYVFDNRLTMAFADKEVRGVVGICESCLGQSENYVNCSDNTCHRHFIICEHCIEKSGGKAVCPNPSHPTTLK